MAKVLVAVRLAESEIALMDRLIPFVAREGLVPAKPDGDATRSDVHRYALRVALGIIERRAVSAGMLLPVHSPLAKKRRGG